MKRLTIYASLLASCLATESYADASAAGATISAANFGNIVVTNGGSFTSKVTLHKETKAGDKAEATATTADIEPGKSVTFVPGDKSDGSTYNFNDGPFVLHVTPKEGGAKDGHCYAISPIRTNADPEGKVVINATSSSVFGIRGAVCTCSLNAKNCSTVKVAFVPLRDAVGQLIKQGAVSAVTSAVGSVGGAVAEHGLNANVQRGTASERAQEPAAEPTAVPAN